MLTNDLSYRAHRDRTSGFLDVVQEWLAHLACSRVLPCHDYPDQLFHAVATAQNQADAMPLVGIYHSGAGSEGIAQALHRHGRDQEVVWLGHELSDEHRALVMQGTIDLVIDQDPDGQVLPAMQHLLFVNEWLEHKPPSGPTEFRLFCAENLPSQSYLPAVPPAV